ncbi:MAG: hypothetical protein WA793_05990 [Sphingorhabdus sp.]|uniref:hypothetical protein n=1 Tax=Sphingorhabdus sp. TaxID=1902408 RepID=UPI003C9BA370
MKSFFRTKHAKMLMVLFCGSGILVALNWQSIMFAFAAAMAEKRPALLVDAKWNDPSSARSFAKKFPIGRPEEELRSWLDENGFVVDDRRMTASRTLKGLPCNEEIFISWTIDSSAKLLAAGVRVSEAGCL